MGIGADIRLTDRDKVTALEQKVGTCHLSFSQALEYLKAGQRMQRAGWNGKGMWVALQVPDSGSKMTLSYLYMKMATGDLVPWLAANPDLLGQDWQVFRE